MRRLRLLTTGAIFLAAAGCVSNDVVVRKQMEMEARLEQLAQGNVAANARMTELAGDLNVLRQQVKDANAELSALRPSHNEVKASLEDVQLRLTEMSKTQGQLQAQFAVTTPTPAAAATTPKIEVVNKEAPAADKEAAPQDAYMRAFGLFSANNYSAAIEAFGAFVKDYPASEYAGNALYWTGECHYTQKNYAKALESFNKVVSEYPKGHKVPDALLKVGFSFINMNEPAKAKTALQSLVEKYPKSPAAAKAREKLSHL